MDKLLMHVALIDQVTKPLQGITKQVSASMNAGRQGMQNMATGGAGLVATGFAIQNALMPAIEMDRKIGEVKSLGVTDDALKQLQATALDFSAEYGKSATEFVEASYDIQSAISGLNGDELSQFTKASGVLAAATKADTGTITKYMGLGFGIFEKQANEMGKGKWVEQFAGMTAKAVQMFSTEGPKMSAALTKLGADASSAGISMSEQMAILGTLQQTMSGSESGTKYKAVLSGLGQAQEKLNLSFTDSQGRMLPMLQILEKIKGKYGDTISVAESMELKTALGSEQAASGLKYLLAHTEQLSNGINELGKVQGMSKAEEMASAMTDQWERLESSWFAVRAAVFGAILPSINAVAGGLADGMVYLTGWTDDFPVLTQILGYVAIAGLSLGGVVASLSLIMGIGQMMSGGWAVTMGALKGVMSLFRLTTIATTAAAWLFNAALWANPITWVVAGIALLVGAFVAAIYWWDDLTAAFKDTAWFNVIASAIEGIVDLLNMIPGVDIELGTSVSDADLKTAEQAAKVQPETPDLKTAQQAQDVNSNVVDINAYRTQPMPDSTLKPNPIMDYKTNANAQQLPPQMVQNMTTNTNTKQGGNIKTFGDVHITTQQAFTPDQLAEWDELNVG